MPNENGSQMRITPGELSLIKNTFKDEAVLKVLRKVFLPELDPSVPLGQNIDLWMTVNIKEQTPEQAYVNLLARNQLITHLDQQLMTLKVLANSEAETPEEAVTRL